MDGHQKDLVNVTGDDVEARKRVRHEAGTGNYKIVHNGDVVSEERVEDVAIAGTPTTHP